MHFGTAHYHTDPQDLKITISNRWRDFTAQAVTMTTMHALIVVSVAPRRDQQGLSEGSSSCYELPSAARHGSVDGRGKRRRGGERRAGIDQRGESGGGKAPSVRHSPDSEIWQSRPMAAQGRGRDGGPAKHGPDTRGRQGGPYGKRRGLRLL